MMAHSQFQLSQMFLLLLLLQNSICVDGSICRPGYVTGFFPKCFKGGYCIVRGDICFNGECCRPVDLQGCPVGRWPNGRCRNRNTPNCRNSCAGDVCCSWVAGFCDICMENGETTLTTPRILNLGSTYPFTTPTTSPTTTTTSGPAA